MSHVELTRTTHVSRGTN